MRRVNTYVLTAVILFAFIIGCSGNGNDPITGNGEAEVTVRDVSEAPQTHLWGYYEVSIDAETQEVDVVPARSSMYATNVVEFLNGNPASLQFGINSTTPAAEYIDVDIDVSIMHPFPGMPAYNGYDVRGIFVGNGSDKMLYNTKLRYAVKGEEQFMMADPNDPYDWGFGKPDGYTRWWNMPEFKISGLFGYTKGIYATPGYTSNAHLNPYKYFADGIAATSHFWDALLNVQGSDGVFRSGSTNTRNYYLRFPNASGIKFAYAVVANWEDPSVHPSNAVEAIAVNVDITEDVWYLNDLYSGGEIIAEFSIFDWNSEVNGLGIMEDYQIIIESTVLSAPYILSEEEMTPVATAANFCTYQIQIPADNVMHADDNDLWILVEYDDANYYNYAYVPNYTDNEPLTAYFREPLPVSDTAINEDPVCDFIIDPVPLFEDLSPVVVTFDATGTYDPDPLDTLTYEWDFNGDGNYHEGPGDSYEGDPDHPTHAYYLGDDLVGDVSLRVRDGNTGEAICTLPVNITVHPSKNLDLRSGRVARDIAIDHTNGDLLVAYDDNSIWKYPRSNFFQSGGIFINTGTPYPMSPEMLDMNAEQYTMVGGLYFTYTSSMIYKPDGTYETMIFYLLWQSTACDIIAMGTQGDMDNDLCFMHGYSQTGIKHNIARRHPNENYFSFGNHDYSFSEIYYDGYDKIYYDYIVGCESDMNDDYIWVLEDADLYASRWELTTAPNDLIYGDAYFGTGEQTDDDDGFYFPRDITRDDQNRLYVLDRLSDDEPRVKIWTVEGDVTTSVGSFGDSTEIIGMPQRIEGSNWEGRVVVLSEEGPGNQHISVFHTIEMPGYVAP